MLHLKGSNQLKGLTTSKIKLNWKFPPGFEPGLNGTGAQHLNHLTIFEYDPEMRVSIENSV